MDDKIFRKANTVSSRSAGDGLNTETGTGRVVIKAAGVDEETNPYGRSLIKLRKRGDEENEPNEEGSDEYGDMPNTGGPDNRKNARRLKLAKGPMVASGMRSIQNAQRVRGKINKLGRKDNANSQKSHLKSEKLSKRQEKVLSGGRSRVIKATYKAADDEKPVSRKRGAIGKEYVIIELCDTVLRECAVSQIYTKEEQKDGKSGKTRRNIFLQGFKVLVR